jgi:hypothetical protein
MGMTLAERLRAAVKARRARTAALAQKERASRRLLKQLRASLGRLRSAERTVAFDGVPVFAGLALALQDARDHGVQFSLNSADRRDGVAERFGKMSQAALFRCSRNCTLDCHGNCNPANPPGFSSHELKSDGNAVYGPRGSSIPWYKLGIDADNAEGLRAWLHGHGYEVVRPYPDGREAQHFSFVADPRANLRKRGRL